MNRVLIRIAAIGLVLATALLLAAGFATDWRFGGKGDFTGPGDTPLRATAGEKVWMPQGDAIAISLPATIHYSAAGKPAVTVRAPAAMLATIRYGSGKLGRSSQPWFGRLQGKIDVTLSGVTLHTISLAGAADADLGTLHQDRLSLAMVGASDVRGAGTLDDLNLSLTGASDARLGRLVVKRLNLTAVGASDATVAATESANISAVGASDIHFTQKPPKLNTQLVGNSSVH